VKIPEVPEAGKILLPSGTEICRKTVLPDTFQLKSAQGLPIPEYNFST
jgi:hypothetical protein